MKRLELIEEIREQRKKAKDIRIKEQLTSEIDALENGLEAGFLDKYISFIYDKPACLLDYFDNAPAAVIVESNSITERIKSYEWHNRENVSAMLSEQSISSKYAVYGKYQVDMDLFAYGRATIQC